MSDYDRNAAEFTLGYAYRLLSELVVEELAEDSPEEAAVRSAMSKIDEAQMCLRRQEAA